MKRIKGLFLLVGILFLTGCVKCDLEMELKSDKSFNFVIIDAILEEYSSMLDGSDTSTYEELGYTVSDYEDSGYVGLKLEKKYDSIDFVSSSDCGIVELTSLVETNTSDIILFKSSKNGSVTTYTANFTYDLSDESDTTSSDVDYSDYNDYMSFTYSFNLPSNAQNISSNADTVNNNGYSLSWDLAYGEVKNITFSFTIDDNDVTSVIVDNVYDNSDSEVVEEETASEKQTTSSQNFSIFSYLCAFLFIVIVFGLIFFTRKKVSCKKSSSTGNIYHSRPPSR